MSDSSAVRVRADLIRLLIFTLVGVLVLVVVGVEFNRTRLVDQTGYRAVFADISSLEPDSPVRMYGVRVGRVLGTGLYDNDKVMVEFEVDEGRALTTATRATVRYENLVGDRFLELTEDPAGGTPLAADEVIPVERTSPALDLDALLGGFRPLFQGLDPAQINELSTGIVKTLQGEAGTVRQLLVRTSSLTSTLADRDRVIGQVVDNLNIVLGTLDERGPQLGATIDRLQELVSGLAADRDPVLTGLERFSTVSDSLAGLLEEARPPLAGTVAEVGRTSEILARNRETVEGVLEDLPVAYLELGRLGAYGTFFNFYLCSLQVQVTGPTGEPIRLPDLRSNLNTERCRDMP